MSFMGNNMQKTGCVLASAAVLGLLGGCRPPDLYYNEPQGPPEYQLGWQDGCDTGISAQGGVIYKFWFGFKKRPEMGNNELYKQGWNEGFSYCRFVIATHPGSG